MQLTAQQLKQFHKDGFIIIRSFLKKNEAEILLNAAKKHIKLSATPIETEEEYRGINRSSKTLRRLRQAYDRDTIFANWMTNNEIRPMLKQILNDTPLLTLAHHNSIMTKFPSKISSTCWHQDRRYWHFLNDNLVSIWLSLDEEYLQNGLLEFIPRSHEMKFNAEQFTQTQCFRTDLEKNRSIIEKRVYSNLNAGDIVLFHCKILHSAHANSTNETKISFVYTVRGEKNLPIEGTRSASKEKILL